MFTRLLRVHSLDYFSLFFYIVAACNPSADDNNVDAQRSTHTSVHILLMRATAARKLERLWARRPRLLQEGRMLAEKMSFFQLHLQLDNYCRAGVDLDNFDCQINAL